MSHASLLIDLTSSPPKGLLFSELSTPFELSLQELETLDEEFVAENLVSNLFSTSFILVIKNCVGR